LLERAVEAVGGEPRTGQQTMARAVADTMRDGGHLLVQAGTGTGKSLGYLVPAIRRAMGASDDGTDGDATDVDGPVVVATATIALQRQLVARDLPALVESLGPMLPKTPTFAILKGRRNYLCLHRFHAGPDDGQGELFETDDAQPAEPAAHPEPAAKPAPSSALGREVARISDWAAHTATGDRDELVPGVSERAWSQVAVSARECLGASNCPYGADCFAERARIRAMRADIVVTNHALLAIDAVGDVPVLPEHDIVVVDEAHELSDRVTGAATQELTSGIVDRAAKRCHRFAAAESDRLAEAGNALATAVAGASEGRLLALPEALGEALSLVRDAARACLAACSASGDRAAAAKGGAQAKAEAVEAARRQARAAVEAVFDTAARMLAAERDDVIWVAVEDRRGVVLRVAPLRVADLLRDTLFARHTTILTSATLALGGSFEPIAATLGIGGPDHWRGIDVGSPFSYDRQGILYVAAHLPPPGRDGLTDAVLDELAGLIEAAGGRTLGLFSSMRAASVAAQAMRSRLDIAVMCQGEDATGELVRLFAKDAECCLFGTLSLWQGVDVPGASCQLVVVDRIPFPRPDDPLMSARARAIAEAGGNCFMAVAASHAALLLAQGTGRLVRSRADRGVVAVLDSRRATARYGAFLRRSLPPFWYTTDPAVVRNSLRALDEAAGGRRRSAPEQPPLDVAEQEVRRPA
jgi:ATP-dependent DNA helicase DinG